MTAIRSVVYRRKHDRLRNHRTRAAVPRRRKGFDQRSGEPGGMGGEAARLGAARAARLRAGVRRRGKGRRGGRRGAGDRKEVGLQQGRHTEDESAEVQQGRGHGGADLSQRGVGAA